VAVAVRPSLEDAARKPCAARRPRGGASSWRNYFFI